MANMSIDNYEGASDSFSWPYNPLSYDDSMDANYTFTNISYQRHHILVSGGGIAPKSTILTGHFSGTNRLVNYRSLAKHFQENYKLKKLYFESDKFQLGVGRQCKKIHAGGRTQFVDYIATFDTVIGILFGDTQRTSGTNQGNVTTFIEEITGTVTNGANPITVSDALGNSWTIPASALTTGQAIVVKLVSMVDSGSGIYVSEYNYATIAGTQTKEIQSTTGFGIIQLAAGANVSTINTSNLTNAVVTFRDGWSA